MGPVSGVVVYLLTWWVTLFCVLPWGNNPDAEPEAGNAKSAPANPRIAKKFLITTLLSAVLWLMIYALIESDVISFHEMARKLAQEENIR